MKDLKITEIDVPGSQIKFYNLNTKYLFPLLRDIKPAKPKKKINVSVIVNYL